MAEPRHLTVLVTGATGNQGGNLAHELMRRGHVVRAFTRHPESGNARILAAGGAELAQGSFEDGDSLRRAAEGVDAAFLMSTPFERGVDAEIEQGLRAIDCLIEAGVEHLVYSSVASADQGTGIPHFESKRRIEEHLAKMDVTWTVVAPASFMENVLWQPRLRHGELLWGIPASRTMQQVALVDLARVTALVLERQDEFRHERLEIASDELTGPQAALILSEVIGRPFRYVERSPDELAGPSEDYRRMLEWLASDGYRVDLAALQGRFPELDWHTFEAWAHSQDWGPLDRYFAEARPPAD